MTAEQIEKVVNSQSENERTVTISFKNRNNFTGVFIKGNDFEELKNKNFWRIVSLNNQEQFFNTGNQNLTRLLHGSDFLKIKAGK